MAYMRGLELVCIGRTLSFEILYEDGRYLNVAGKEVEDLVDRTCFDCSASYYTLDGQESIAFCPNCGRFERMRHETLAALLEWSRGQNFDFLRFSGSKAFAVQVEGEWELRFAATEDDLRKRGLRREIHLV